MQRSSQYAMSSLRHCRRFLHFDLACGRVMETMQPLMNTIWRSLSTCNPCGSLLLSANRFSCFFA
ncbi:uncharacterized protein [Blastocystis hominis]|uniref:Uncharacterized protein n=1 Tax=Blastocystis hominis TaxID=12968 RepID=D8LZJ4_BLAHO|nr:uncharacterized protein [Blastocystis hominis]CBK21233.2 unnamed protein product [Blastocystis hominis]|eukprot:XP_012895281.1 uncharacterized protein [Blastocystis hominis]